MYSVYDLRCDGYLTAGRNSHTEKKCVEEVIEWLSEGMSPELIEQSFNGDTKNKIKQLKLMDFEVEEHNQIIVGQWIKPEKRSKDGSC